VQLKSFYLTFIFIVCIVAPALVMASSFSASDTATTDSLKTPRPDFTNVNVIVETAWGTIDKSVNVDVFVKMEGKKPSEIVLMKGQHQECSIELVEGVMVKITDPKSGRLLKRYGRAE
jgi:hypothetical protein